MEAPVSQRLSIPNRAGDAESWDYILDGIYLYKINNKYNKQSMIPASSGESCSVYL
ncbi:hypothetical protein D3C75_1254540 [compost metagenome]